jgi:hypothetical protein
MKPLFFICQLMIAVTTLGQSTGNQLQLNGFLIAPGIGKDGSLALATQEGEIGLAGSMTSGWRRADIVASDLGVLGLSVKNSCFYNKDTGFVSGHINSKKNKYGIIYRTTDGGKKWQAVNFGPGGYVVNAAYNDNGEAWLSVAESNITYTNDYGLTWKKFKIPNVKERFAAIFFNTSSQGLIGSTENLLYYTPDNCRNWKKLPTPLDQKKYNKTNRWSEPVFERVAIYKDYFLVVQENLVFYSKRDSINWIWLPDYNDLYTDAGNSALFFKRNRNNYVRAGDNFKPVYTFEVNGNDAICKNGSLFIAGYREIFQLTPANDTASTLFEKRKDAAEPDYLGLSDSGSIGYKDNKIFVQKNNQESWDYLFTLPMLLDSNADIVLTRDDRLLYKRGDDSLFYFDLSGRLQKKTTKDAMLSGFVKSGIDKIFFSRSSFHALQNEWETIQYKNLGTEFGDTILTKNEETESGRKWLPENKDRFDAKDVSDFISQLPALYNSTHKTSLEELGFTENDFKQCKKDIQAFRELKSDDKKDGNEEGFVFARNNLDFDRLLNLVDTIQHMNSSEVYDLLMSISHFRGTRISCRTIRFVDNDNEELSVTNSYSGLPDAFYFPWHLELNGVKIKSADININRFIEKVYPAFLKDSPGRMELLYEFVKMLY